jgi:pSer/pThr/pTyr-binding forkhead associated (FHA) protein
MSAEVRLTITHGLSEGKVFVFRERSRGAIGRANDCLLCLPNGFAHMDVSRHHCLLEVEPPLIRVRDLGSRNGTYVNGEKIGQRERGLGPEEVLAFDMPLRALHEGDEVGVGCTRFRVSIVGDEAAAEESGQAAEASGALAG